MLRAWDGANAPEGLKALEQRLDKGEFGPIASFLAPAMSKARSASDKAYASLAEAEAALMKKP